MRKAIRQRLIVTYGISLGLMTVVMSLFHPTIPSASAQQLTGTVNQEASGTVTQGRRIEHLGPTSPYPTIFLENKDAQISARKPHRLIRKPQNAPVASVEPSPSDSSPLTAMPTHTPSLQSDNRTSQSKDPSSPSRSAGAAVPLATMNVAPSSATTMGSNAAGTASNGTIPLAAAGGGNSSTSGSGSTGGRSMSRLAAELPGLAQLIAPPSAPAVSINPAIGASPTSFAFTAQAGSNPATQTLNISNTGGGTLSWSATNNAPWLILSQVSGTGSSSVTLTVTTGTLTAGTQSGMITLSAPGATSVSVPVTFTVTAAPVPPAIGFSPTSLSFTAQQGGSNPATQALTISNTGGGTLSWTATDNTTWLTVSPASGTGNGTLTVTATGTQTAGTQTGTITLNATGATSVPVNVTFTVTAAPAIGFSPTSLSFTAQAGGSNPATQTISLSNTGGGALSWTATDNATWLTVSPASGTGNGTLTVTATGTQTAGTQTGTITLNATGATSVSVNVTFTVTAVPNISLNPSSLSYAATQGAANPANKTVSLTTTGGTLNWTVGRTVSSNIAWLTVSPASGNSNSTLTASVNTAGLAAGTHTGTITVSAAGASSKTVDVTLTVSAPSTASATLAWNANTESDLDVYKVYRAMASGAYGAPIATLPKSVTSYIATGLQLGTTYFFVITASDLAGNESVRSSEVSKSF